MKNKKILIILSALLAAVLLAALVLLVVMPAIHKNGYIARHGQETYDRLRNLSVGDYVTLGSYEQDNDKNNGAEPIQWLVLDVQPGKALLISRYVLDCKPYSNTEADITWEKCYIRKWLNSDFFNTAFTESQQALILQTRVEPDKKEDHKTDTGPATNDRVFLLGYLEAERYFSGSEDRRCQATAYAKYRGVIAGVENGVCWWWLRSPGYSQTFASYVLLDGYAYAGGCRAYDDSVGVRPVICIELPTA